jgi:hypothetical protein
VFSTAFTADARFVLSGSDDGNVRIWKAKASDKLGVIDARERAAMEYRDSLKERWKMDAEVGKVVEVSARSPRRRICRGPSHSPVPPSKDTFADHDRRV